MKQIFLLVIIALCLACSNEQKALTIHTIGDSTMADYEENTTDVRGWGEMLAHIVPEGVVVDNQAIPGRSSRSFYSEGSWAKVLSSVKPGDYVLIQFAHNNEKENGLDGADGRGTAPWTTYTTYLTKYVEETRAAGGTPILVQPVVRRYFDGNYITARGRHNLSPSDADTTLDYTAAMRWVASQTNTPLIDLCTQTRKIVEAYGPIDSKSQVFVAADNTHTSAGGATLFAVAAAQILDTMNIWHGKLRLSGILTNPAVYDYGQVFVGDTAWQCFDIACLDGLQGSDFKVFAKNYDVCVSAPRGYLLSHRLGETPKDTLILSGTRVASFFACYVPSDTLLQKYIIELSSGCGRGSIAVCGKGRQVLNSEPISVVWSDLSRRATTQGVDAKVSIIKGLAKVDSTFAIVDGRWPADIDEDGSRFVQLKLTAQDKDLNINRVELTSSANICYRLSYAFGNDFFMRSTIGEKQHETTTSVHDIYNTSIRVPAKQTVLFRLYPWSRSESDSKTLSLKDVVISGVAVE